MKQMAKIISKKTDYTGFLPAWKASLFLFAVLIIIVLLYFLLQIRQLQQIFLTHSLEHSKILASVIERNARSAALSQETVEKIIRIFLGNTAKFIDYLDAVEPFSEKELLEFALESGLAGICIVRDTNEYTQGPENWLKFETISCHTKNRILKHLPLKHLFLLTLPRTEAQGCIILGFAAAHIEKLHEQIGVSHLLESLTGLSYIKYVHIESGKISKANLSSSNVSIKEYKNTQVAETRLAFGEDMLVLGMDTRHFLARSRQLWNEFFFFSAILAFFGIFFSWLFHQSQTRYLTRIREIERELARQREDAALGRSAAAITHEIRNPLNAMSMGLQRLQIEADDLSDEYQQLIADILKALKRTNSIVSNIRQYARPLEPQKKSIKPKEIIDHILSLYSKKCEDYSIRIHSNVSEDYKINADPGMIEQVIENLIKNAVEAQLPDIHPDIKTDTRYIKISTDINRQYAIINIENNGFKMPENRPLQILEPYYTTKTRGTGLGLSIVQKIIYAHQGYMNLDIPKSGIIRITIFLPYK